MSKLNYQANFGDFDVYVDENNAYALKKYHPEVAGVSEEYTLSGQDMKTLLFECQKINESTDSQEKEEHKEFIVREILA
ncbi:hypothetical protein LFYK43_05650 [Ligilactobacillus salitolerans]|uniref:Uncharacterized protein n=1 Tax=Ligilactobacillus salitolerans TaxID=1808352 RepID=A0A401IRF0_9LACO|nr:hypothetical protein [Ligilactobacillus salitolerans]GBG94106.1 hypothetical protein LFYK43_05650 [Ligilactobacillus salitolerans]